MQFNITLVIIIVIILFYIKNTEQFTDTRSFYELTDGEKTQYIVNTYFLGPDEQPGGVKGAQIKKENDYIQTLPQDDTTCTDKFDKCPEWAANSECIINPEFMLYSCAKSCKSCSLSDQDKYNLVKIYNSREPPSCVNHDDKKTHNYPDPGHYMRQFDLYVNENAIL